nr:MAC/perforin domain-containing protein [uncultured Sphingobacterium sp.]
MKRNKLIGAVVFSIALLTNCSKNDTSTELSLNNNSKNQASGGDGKWDVIGYGIDATSDMLETNSMSDVSILNMYQFESDFKDKNDPKNEKVIGLDVNSVGGGAYDIFTGYTAQDYLKNVSTKKSIGVNGNVSVPLASDPAASGQKLLNFTGNFSKNNEDSSKTSTSSRYSYAMFEMWHRVKRIRFTEDVSTQTLIKYLTPEFKNYVATKTATEIVNRYGTHILLDISLGGRIRIDYSGHANYASTETQKITTIKAGLGVSVLNMFGININTDKTKAEVTKLTNETIKKDYHGKYYGGNNTGTSISIDSEGKTSSNFNLASWQQGITERNAALINIDKAVFIYDFIADPTKKAQVKAAVEKYIKDRQIKQVNDEFVPIWYPNTVLLTRGETVYSTNKKYALTLQAYDGNLVLYNLGTGEALWATDKHNGQKVIFQTDGNLVVLSASGSVVWASNVYWKNQDLTGSKTIHFILQDDGNFVLYDNKRPVAKTDTSTSRSKHGGKLK